MSIHIGADLNGHVGASNIPFVGVHRGYDFGGINKQGLELLKFASKYNFEILNTHFKKTEEHLITYKSL